MIKPKSEWVNRSKSDFYFFAKYVLGYSKMTKYPHEDLCKYIQESKNEKHLILMPRGSFKSSVITISHSLFSLINNNDLRILISHELQKNAVKYAKEIKTHIEKNEKFRSLFGNWVNKKNTWRDDQFIIKPRKKNKKEPSIYTSSVEKGSITGLHFDKIYLDDPVSKNNTKTSDQIERTIEYYKLLLSILDPDGQLYICGTRWHRNDLYGWILDYHKKRFSVYIKKAVDKNGNLLMPEVLSKKFLDEVKETQGEEMFSHQYQNEPMSSLTQAFNPNDIQFYEKAPNGLYHFMSIDCAISTSKDADYTGLIVNGVDYENNYYIREAIKEKLKPSQLIDLVFDMANKYSPIYALGLETNALDQAIKSLILERMDQKNIWFPIVDIVVGSNISKKNRINWLEMKTRSKKIFIKKEHTDLYDEFKNYPQIKHDDLLDALKTQIKITFPSDVKPVSLKKDSFNEKIWRSCQKEADQAERRRVWRTM